VGKALILVRYLISARNFTQCFSNLIPDKSFMENTSQDVSYRETIQIV
jgi:hypothetical protein